MRYQCCPSLPVGTQVRQYISEKQKSPGNQQNRREIVGQSSNTSHPFANPEKCCADEQEKNDTTLAASDNGTGGVHGRKSDKLVPVMRRTGHNVNNVAPVLLSKSSYWTGGA